MQLYLNGQDINRIVLANAQDLTTLRTVSVGPEEYLKTLNAFLEKQGVHPSKLDRLLVVVGPGSATALRTSLAIANTIKFVYRVSTVAIEKEPGEQDLDTLKRLATQSVKEVEHKKYLQPIYASGPKITRSNKDALGRE